MSTRYRLVAGIPLLLEEWSFEGIRGETAVFLSEHVAGKDDAALENFLREQAGVDVSGSVTVVRRGEYVLVNFGFEAT